MRRALSFDCKGATLAATLDEGHGETGLLIVSGGNEIRIGAHRGMATLAGEIAAQGHPVFRFDRRGVGDSEGVNGGFEASGPDIEAAITAFRAQCPGLKRIVAFGNCDAASALALYRPAGLAGLVLANPWVIERGDELPSQAAIRVRYAERLRDPKAWVGLFTGAINLSKLMRGLFHLARPRPTSSLSRAVAQGVAAFPGTITILLAARDGTAIAFADEWEKPDYAAARAKVNLSLVRLDTASHSFAGAEDKAALSATLLSALA